MNDEQAKRLREYLESQQLPTHLTVEQLLKSPDSLWPSQCAWLREFKREVLASLKHV